MDWQKYRLAIGGTVLVVLLGLVIYLFYQRNQETQGLAGGTTLPSMPEVDGDAVTELTVSRPGEGDAARQTVRLVKRDGAWRVAEPVDARADVTAIEGALEKLAGLEVENVAARLTKNHARLEVDEAKGLHVIAKHGESVVADLWIGVTRGGTTMVRVEGQEVVAAVEGSIRYAFDKELRDWRDRAITDVDPAAVRDVSFRSANGSYHFVRPESDWRLADGEPAIERFAPSKVLSIVSSLSRMRASDFGAADVTPAQAGLTGADCGATPAPVPGAVDAGVDAGPAPFCTTIVTFVADAGDAGPTGPVTLRIGKKKDGADDYYVQREGDETVYLVSAYAASRASPSVVELQEAPDSGMPPMPPTPPPPEMPGMGGMGGPGGGQIPPEIMEQIQRQIQQQGGGGR